MIARAAPSGPDQHYNFWGRQDPYWSQSQVHGPEDVRREDNGHFVGSSHHMPQADADLLPLDYDAQKLSHDNRCNDDEDDLRLWRQGHSQAESWEDQNVANHLWTQGASDHHSSITKERDIYDLIDFNDLGIEDTNDDNCVIISDDEEVPNTHDASSSQQAIVIEDDNNSDEDSDAIKAVMRNAIKLFKSETKRKRQTASKVIKEILGSDKSIRKKVLEPSTFVEGMQDLVQLYRVKYKAKGWTKGKLRWPKEYRD